VDALCINQTDILEKEEQVAMMGKIYQLAERVIIWLGEEIEITGTRSDERDRPNSILGPSPNSRLYPEETTAGVSATLAFIYIGRMAVDSTSTLASIRSLIEHPVDVYPETNRPAADMMVEAFKNIVYRPWFRRAWTLQEVLLAKDALVICGECSAGWDEFAGAFKTIAKGVETLRWVGKEFESLDACRDIISRNRGVLKDLLLTTRHRMAEDPRDKVFSLLGLLDDMMLVYGGRVRNAGWKLVSADYRQSTAAVFTSLARISIAKDENLEILAAAGLSNATPELKWDEYVMLQRTESWDSDLARILDVPRSRDVTGPNYLPSWVPDWSSASSMAKLEAEAASGARPSHRDSFRPEGAIDQDQGHVGMRISLSLVAYAFRKNATKTEILWDPVEKHLRLRGFAVARITAYCDSTFVVTGFPSCALKNINRRSTSRTHPLDGKEILEVHHALSKHEEQACKCSSRSATKGYPQLGLPENQLPNAVRVGDWLCLLQGDEGCFAVRPDMEDPFFVLVGRLNKPDGSRQVFRRSKNPLKPALTVTHNQSEATYSCIWMKVVLR